ncbi:hypothetical protein AB0H12_13135 [Actinosynnema sp. NPDC023794]
MRAMLDTYGVPFSQWEPYMEMCARALEKGWWTKYDLDDQGYISLDTTRPRSPTSRSPT